MATKYVRETKAGKSVSAYLIRKRGREIGTVLVHFSAGGTVLVNIFQRDASALRCAKGDKQAARQFLFQHATAGGYGYDKLTAALSGLYIDGHKLTNHCEVSLVPPKGRKVWPRDATPPRGFRFANYHAKYITFGFDPKKHKNPNFRGEEGYTNCYRESGLNYLKALGYIVDQVL
jgi:hypothetical protein